MGWFNIRYLQEPNLATRGAGLAAIGDSLIKLGAVAQNRETLNQKEREANEARAMAEKEFNLKLQDFDNTQKHRDREYRLSLDKLKADQDIALGNLDIARQNADTNAQYRKDMAANAALLRRMQMQESEQKQKDRAANIAAFRKIAPELTKGMNDDEVWALGETIQKQYLAGLKGGDDWLEVDKNFYEKYADSANGEVKNTKNGFMVRKTFIDKIVREADKGLPEGYSDRIKRLRNEKPLVFGDGEM